MAAAACSSDSGTETSDESSDTDVSESGETEDGGAADGEDSTSDSDSASASDYTGSYELADDAFGTMVTVEVADGVRTIETNALPNHETGEFPNDANPNSISAQDVTWEFPSEPVFAGTAENVKNTGVSVNGLKLDPGTAETMECESGENLRIEAMQDSYDVGLDFNNAHVQPTGEYHYHGASELLVDLYATDEDLVHVAFAADGHLIYYSKSGAYQSGWELSEETRTGTDCLPSLARDFDYDVEDLEGTTPDGTFLSDWVYSEEAGNLDECNGTTVDGEYLYVMTDTFPYIPRCLNGEFTEDRPGG